MKICFDNEIFWTQKFGAISSRYFFNLIKILSDKSDLDVKVFAKFYLNNKLDDLSKQIVVGNKLKFKPPFTGIIYKKLNSIFLNKEINLFKPDIIHKTYYSNHLNNPNKSKVVLTVFDLWHEKNSNKFNRPKKYSLDVSDHIVCPSISTKNDLIEIYNIHPKRITVTYFGIEKFENIKIRNNYINIQKRFLLFIGARGRYKNFNNFIKAYSKSERIIKDFDIICFGGGDFSLDEINLFKKLNIINSIHKEKNNDDQTLLTLYKNAKCLVYPSAHEGFGLPPIEAMSQGCPAFTSNHVAVIEGVGNAAATFNADNVLEIQSVMERYLFSDMKLKKLIDLGKKQSIKFSWDKCVNETLKVYKNLLH
jgi:glycosyltransferase involved in cell wall biosynthesis